MDVIFCFGWWWWLSDRAKGGDWQVLPPPASGRARWCVATGRAAGWACGPSCHTHRVRFAVCAYCEWLGGGWWFLDMPRTPHHTPRPVGPSRSLRASYVFVCSTLNRAPVGQGLQPGALGLRPRAAFVSFIKCCTNLAAFNVAFLTYKSNELTTPRQAAES